MPSPDRTPSLPRLLWVGVPLLLAVLPGAVRAFDSDLFSRWFRTELGLVEIATAVFLAVAVLAAVGVLRHAREFPAPWLKLWFGLFLLGCVYFLGEEISWGQHFFGWSTPEVLAEANDQAETNLHNLGGWAGRLLDQLPRNILTLAALVGGVLAPLMLRKRRQAWDPARQVAPWIWPTLVALPAALGALLIGMPETFLDEPLPAFFDIQDGESKEAFLAFFLMIYILTVWRIAATASKRSGAGEEASSATS